MKARNIYWVAQIAGWFAYGSLILLAVYNTPNSLDKAAVISVGLLVGLGILMTHFQRWFFIRWGWLDYKLPPLIPRLLITSAICSAIINASILGFDKLIQLDEHAYDDFKWSSIVISTFSLSILILFWNAIYFTFHFFQKSRNQEVSNLELTASNRESELKNLRSQLNPHFLFNSLNSIRALVDIEPAKAKKSITTLSNLLRQSLMVGKENMVTIEQELDIVRNYLDLEKIRFEERLNVHWEIDDSLNFKEIPPFSIQMMAENAVKHGISNLKEGGDVVVSIIRTEGGFSLQIRNSGQLATKTDLGVGIQNIKQRLKLQFGADATFSLIEEGGNVIAKIEFTDERI